MHATRITCPNSVLYVEDHEGIGPPLILLHGLTSDLRTWDQVASRLAEAFRVVALDLPGHGQSPPTTGLTLESIVEDVVYLATHLGLGSPAIWGHSAGGYAGLLYASRHPTSAVLCEDSGWGAPAGVITDANVERARKRQDLPSDLHRAVNASVVEAIRRAPETLRACRCPVQLVFASPSTPQIGLRRWTAAFVADHAHIEVTWLDTPEHDLHTVMPDTMLGVASRFFRAALGGPPAAE